MFVPSGGETALRGPGDSGVRKENLTETGNQNLLVRMSEQLQSLQLLPHLYLVVLLDLVPGTLALVLLHQAVP